MVLHLFDCSEYISAGLRDVRVSRLVKDNGPFREEYIPSGGIAYLLNTVNEFSSSNDELVYCFDRPPTFKRELHERAFGELNGYKGNRSSKRDDIIYQRKMAEALLRELGACVIAVDDYESDDVIASIVKYYKDDYEKIVIHANDSDFYYLVCENVEVVSMNGRGKHVTRYNWENTVISDSWLPYGLMTLQKIIKGEPGDNVPAISKQMKERFLHYLGPIKEDRDFSQFADADYTRKWCEIVSQRDERTMAVVDMIIPRIAPFESVELYESELSMQEYWFVALNVGCKYAHDLRDSDVILPSNREERYEEIFKEFIDLYSRR